MRLTASCLLWLVIGLGATLAEDDTPGCKYGKGDGFDGGQCDPATGQRSMTLMLKKGDPAVCPPSKVITRSCKRGNKNSPEEDGLEESDSSCKYEWDEDAAEVACDPVTGLKTIHMTLVEGDPALCETTKTSQRKCNGKEGKGRGKAGKKNKGRRKNQAANEGKKGNKGLRKEKNEDECRYNVDKHDDDHDEVKCDPLTSTKSITLALKPGSPDTCPATKTITKECVPEGCVYDTGEWSECTEGSKFTERVDTLTSSPEGVTCKPTFTRTRSCRKMSKIEDRKSKNKEAKKERKNEVKEEKKKAKLERKQAKKEAKKDRREKAQQKKNRDKKKDRKERRQERKDRKNRRSGKCRYNAGVWEDCVEGMRTMTQTLAKGNPDLCEPEKIRTAPCVNKKGEERCFFGPWGEFGECNNGVRTKVRPVISSNGDECQRRAVRTQPC